MTKIDAKQTGVLIRERRQAIGWTQKQLADALFVTDKAISKWENGDGLPDISLLVQLAAALQITTDELLAGTQREMSEPVIWQKNPLAAWLATGIVFYLWLNQLVGRVSSILVNRFWFDAGPGHPREPITGLLFVLLINQVFLAGLVFVIASLPRGMKRFSRGLRVGSLVLMSCGVPLSLSHIWIDITGLLAEYGSYVLIALALFLAVWQSKRWLVRVFYYLACLALAGELAAHLVFVFDPAATTGLRVAALPLALGRLLLLLAWILAHKSLFPDQPACRNRS